MPQEIEGSGVSSMASLIQRYNRRPVADNLSNHVKKAFPEAIQQHTQRFFHRRFRLVSMVSFYKIKDTIFAFVILNTTYDDVFDEGVTLQNLREGIKRIKADHI